MSDSTLASKTRNVSASGLAVKLPANQNKHLTAGQVINVSFDRLPGFNVPARVVRINGGDIGLELEASQLSRSDINNIIRTAPFAQRTRTQLSEALWQAARRIGLVLANTALRPLIVKLTAPRFLFAVYGNERDVSTYGSRSVLEKLPNIIIGSFIQCQGKKGFMVGCKYLEHELSSDSEKIKEYAENLKKAFPTVEAIALVGRMPNFVMKAGLPLEAPFVDGSTGTRFMIWDVARKMKELPQYQGEETICVLGGAGRIGNHVCNDIAREYQRVIAYDARYEEDEVISTPGGSILKTSNPNHLNECKLYIGLTHHGDVIKEFMHHMPSGSLIADDTHPCISPEVRQQMKPLGIDVLKIVLAQKSFSMWPRMPAWNRKSIPGCLMETLVVVERKDGDVSNFSWFIKAAQELGYEGQLIKPIRI